MLSPASLAPAFHFAESAGPLHHSGPSAPIYRRWVCADHVASLTGVGWGRCPQVVATITAVTSYHAVDSGVLTPVNGAESRLHFHHGTYIMQCSVQAT